MSPKNTSSQDEAIDPVDILIGKNVRFYRSILGLTQKDLAQQIGLSAQQVQKYEAGTNKMHASRLYHISQILKTPLDDFFKDEIVSGMSDQQQDGFVHDHVLDNKETAELIRVYYDIDDKKKRKIAVDMMKSLTS